jgi:two-component system, cell cycle sensor histidine kinase and response regulator CckA
MLELNQSPHQLPIVFNLSVPLMFALIALLIIAPARSPRLSIKSFSKFAGLMVIVTGLLVITGWGLHIEVFKSVLPGLVTMKVNVALCLLLLGSALLLLQEERGPRTQFAGRLLALLAAALGLATLSQYHFGWDLGIDQLFFNQAVGSEPVLYSGRMAPATALLLFLLGCGLGLFHARFYWATHLLTSLTLTLSFVALLGYLYKVESLYKIGAYSSVALHTSAAVFLLCLGIFCARPDQGFMKICFSDSPGGLMVRRLLPMAVLTSVVLGLVRLMGQRAGFYGTEVGLSLMVTSSVIALAAIILWNATSLYRMDIKRKEAEGALWATEERYRDLFENANDMIYTIDLQGNFISVNRMTTEVTGYTSEETASLNMAQIIAPEYAELASRNFTEKLLGKSEATIYTLEIICKNGRRLPVEVNSRLIYEAGKPVAIQGIARDISERQRLEDQLRQAQKMESVGRLAGGVAHDFNNLLTAIIGYSQMAMRHLDPDAPVQKEIHEVERAGKRAAELTSQLLAFSRKQALQTTTLDLNLMVINIEKMLCRLIGEDIELSTKLAADLSKVKADPGQIEQIIMNLAVNARDAMPGTGKLTIETANVELDEAYTQNHLTVNPGQYVMLAFSDTGVGMDKETQSQIFEPFFTTKESGKGTGLGLSTVYGIVKQSGGNIWVYSEPGKGTTFKIYFPALEMSAKAEEARAPLAEPVKGTETILLVEDDESVRKIVSRILETNGYKVLQATSTADALQLYKLHTDEIDLLITDVIMPFMSGQELVQKISSFGNEIKVLYMSGYTDNAIVHHGVLEADRPFLQKPFSPEALARKVRAVITAP